MLIKYNKQDGGWDITRISEEEKKVLEEMGFQLLLSSISNFLTKEIKAELNNEQKRAKKSTKH